MRCSIFDVYILIAFPQPNKCKPKPDETRCRLRIWKFEYDSLTRLHKYRLHRDEQKPATVLTGCT